MHEDATWYGIRPESGHSVLEVTGQLADTPTRGLPTRGLDISRTGQLADWTSRGLDNLRSRMPPKRKTKLAKSPMASAGCPVRDLSSSELSSPRVDQSARCPVRESSSPRVGNPRVGVYASCPVTVLDGFPALRERGRAPSPLLGPCLLWQRSPISATAELLYLHATYDQNPVFLPLPAL